MEAKAKFLGHPIHQMIIVLPLGLLTTAVVSMSSICSAAASAGPRLPIG